MSEKLTIGLPVMLHKEEEIRAFLAAKERIQTWGDSIGQPLEVGVFLFYIPPAMKAENMTQQLENQERYQLPIVHAQATWQTRHHLIFSGKDDPESNGLDLMEKVIEQTAALRAYDSRKSPVEISVNVGGFLCRDFFTTQPSPVMLAPNEFDQQRTTLYYRAKERFTSLSAFAAQKNLGIALENGITSVFVPHPHFKDNTPRMHPHIFNDLNSLVDISGDRIVLDTAHWAASHIAPALIERNGAVEDKAMIYQMEQITSWNGYWLRHRPLNDYMPHAQVFHIANSSGIGMYLPTPELNDRWGEVGTSPEGIVPRADFHRIVNFARNKHRPLVIEVDYDIKNIQQNQYKEADPMLTYILTYE